MVRLVGYHYIHSVGQYNDYIGYVFFLVGPRPTRKTYTVTIIE